MTKFHVGIDGYNLALPNGTGVATYGHVLADTLRAGGHEVAGLFGVDAGRDPAMRELLFYDRLGHVPPTPHLRRKRSRRILRAALRPFHVRRADEVPQSGRIETANLAERLPVFDQLATAHDRHHEVRDEDVDAAFVRLHALERFNSIGGCQYPIAGPL